MDLRQGELQNAVVYGSYAAVQYADAVMLRRLAESIPSLMTGISKQAVRSYELNPCTCKSRHLNLASAGRV